MKKFTALLSILILPVMALAQSAPPSPTNSPAARKDLLGLGNLSKDRPKGSITEITAQEEATFDEKENKAVFRGEVRVKDPAFLLSSDRLTVYLTKDRTGIERAVADGNVVIVQQTKDDSQKGAVGRSSEAEYIPAQGKITLSGSPEIQQGINRHVATSPNTRMILNRDGRATSDGPSRTMITDTTDTSLKSLQ